MNARRPAVPARPGATAPGRRQWLVKAAACALGVQLPALAQRTGALPTPFSWPDITLLDDSVIPAASWADTAAVLVFWATYCPFCRRHNAHVQKLHEAVAGQRLRVLTFATDRDPAKVRSYLLQHGYSFPVSLQDAEPMRQRLGLLRTIPTTLGIQRNGRVGLAMPGEMFEEDVMALAALAREP